MRIRHIPVVVALVILFSVWTAYARDPDSSSDPGSTSSYTLEDIYNRLDTGAAGAQSTFTEPSSGPGTGTGHTLNEIMGKAPAADNTVDSLVATSSAVTVTIRNAGTTAVNDAFWVDAYFNPTETPTVNHQWDAIASHGVVWGVTTSIPAGGSLVLTTGGDYYFPEYSRPATLPVRANVYALVDSINYATTYGAVQESNEGNNLFGPVTPTASVAGQGAPIGQGQPASREGLPPRQ